MPEREQRPAQRLLRGRRFSERSSKPGWNFLVCGAVIDLPEGFAAMLQLQ